jgi:hypothetical protein
MIYLFTELMFLELALSAWKEFSEISHFFQNVKYYQ